MEYQHWIASSCEYIKSHNPRKAWQWIKKTAKIGKSVSTNPIQLRIRMII